MSDGPPTDQAGWDGERYDRIADPQQRWGKAILPRVDLQGTEVVLDAGCGTGRVTEELLSRVPNGRVVALDASTSMLDQARRRLGRGDREPASFSAISWPLTRNASTSSVNSWLDPIRQVTSPLLEPVAQALTTHHPE